MYYKPNQLLYQYTVTQQTKVIGVRREKERTPRKELVRDWIGKINIEDRRRTRSQGPPSLLDGDELIQQDSLPDLARIERECAETLILFR